MQFPVELQAVLNMLSSEVEKLCVCVSVCVCMWLSVGNRAVILQYRGCGELCNALLLTYILLKMH